MNALTEFLLWIQHIQHILYNYTVYVTLLHYLTSTRHHCCDYPNEAMWYKC